MPGELHKNVIANDGIKLMTDNPALKNKIKLDIEPGADKIYWYIKFNIALDPATVNRKTMKVMEPNGYILETETSYRTDGNMIVLSPIDSFAQDEYYILKITKKVSSAKGRSMRNEVNILFKLLGGEISEFQILKSTVKLPNPKPRPKNYVPIGLEPATRIYTHGGDRFEGKSQDKLPFGHMKINVLVGVIGMFLTLVSLFSSMLWLTVSCSIVCLAGVTHILVQFARKPLRSAISYNRGALAFNSGKYTKAERLLKKACELDKSNEMAEYAMTKLKFYL